MLSVLLCNLCIFISRSSVYTLGTTNAYINVMLFMGSYEIAYRWVQSLLLNPCQPARYRVLYKSLRANVTTTSECYRRDGLLKNGFVCLKVGR